MSYLFPETLTPVLLIPKSKVTGIIRDLSSLVNKVSSLETISYTLRGKLLETSKALLSAQFCLYEKFDLQDRRGKPDGVITKSVG